MQRGSPDPSDLRKKLAKLVAQALVDLVVAAVVGWLLVQTKKALDAPSLSTLEEACAVASVLVGVTFGGRLAVQIRIGYLWWEGSEAKGWTSRKRLLLCGLTVANLPLTAAMIGAGVYFYSHRNAGLQLGVTLALGFLLAVSINQTMELIKLGGPPRGSDVVWRCRPVRWLRRSTEHWNRVPGVEALVRTWDDRLPRNHSSRLAITMVFTTLIAVLALAGAVGMRVAGYESKLEAHVHLSASVEPSPSQPERQTQSVGLENAVGDSDPCHGAARAGEGAPEPLAEAIHRAMEEIGPAAGCPGRARRIAGSNVYAVVNHCQGRFWSLAIASPVHPAAVLLDDAAEAARRLVANGELLGASPRKDLLAGDFHFLFTAMGPYVLIRRQKTDGHGGTSGAPKDCTELEPGRERYVVLWPGMAEVWLEFTELVAPVWPEQRPLGDAGDLDSLRFRTDGGTVVARGHCTSETDCVINGASLHLQSKGMAAETVTVERLIARMSI